MTDNASHVIIVNASPQDATTYTAVLHAGLGDNIQVSVADDVEDGLALCQSGDPYCVILCHDPPDVDGLVFLTGLKFADSSQPPPIVMIAGDGVVNGTLDALKRGADDCLAKSEVTPPQLARAVRNAVEKATLRCQLSEARAEVARLAFYDPATGLASRRLFNDRIAHAVELASRIDIHVCLLMVDVDGLSVIHDSLGLTARDRALREVALRLSKVARRADTIARLGGDDFALLMETGSTVDGASILAEKILESLEQPIDLDGDSFVLGVSIGISMLTGEGSDLVVRQADTAMSEARRSGGGYRVFVADDVKGKKKKRSSAR